MPWNSATSAPVGRRGEEARPDGVAPELVEQQPARRDPRQLDPLQRGEVRGGAAAEVIVDERELRREHRVRVELDLLLEHEPLEHDAGRDVAIADRTRQRVDCTRPDLARGQRADDAGAQLLELADRQRRVQRRPGSSRAAAQVLVAHPEVDAHGLALVLVDPGRAEGRPAPRPDRVRSQLLRHPSRRERLQLHDLEPLRPRLQPLAPARARRGLELELERDPARRDPDVRELAHERAHAATHRPARPDRPERVQLRHVRRGEEDLPDQQRRRGQVAPPLRRIAARVGRVRDRHGGNRAPLLQPPYERERIGAVLGGRRRPRGRRLGAEELVQGDPRRLAARHRDGEVEEPVGALLDQRRVGRHRRRADAVVEVEVEEDGRRPVLARLRRLDRAGRERERQPRLLRQRRVVAREVDPERVRVRDPALAGECTAGSDQGQSDGDQNGAAHALVVAATAAGRGEASSSAATDTTTG